MNAILVDLLVCGHYRSAMPKSHVHHGDTPDLRAIRREARALKRAGGSMTYMQYLDQVARRRYGVRHFHEAQKRVQRAATGAVPAALLSPAQHYLQSMQEYYLDI